MTILTIRPRKGHEDTPLQQSNVSVRVLVGHEKGHAKVRIKCACPQMRFLGVFEDGAKWLKIAILRHLRTRGLYIGNRDKSPSSRILIYSDTLNRLR